MDREELKRQRLAINAKSEALWKNIEAHRKEEERVINVLHKAKSIIEDLNNTFEERTSLSKTDVSILMLATVLQLVRIYCLPKFQERYLDENRLEHDDSIIRDMEKEEIEHYKKEKESIWETKKSKKGYRSWQEIAFTKTPPYDTCVHSGEGFNDRNMHGGYHRVKTLGHDPILGWIFGVANIITDTITICPEYVLGEKKIRLPYVETYKVDMVSHCWKERLATGSMFKNTIESISEDKHRLYAAIFAQGLHLASDKYTKTGLPIPFLSLIDPDKAYEIYKDGYDYLDYLYDTQILRRTFNSTSQAIMINMVIGSLHKLFYNPKKDFDQKLYNVRTRKIILYSNMIATTSDVVQTAVRSYLGDENAINNFDLGGFLVTMYRLITDTRYIIKIKEEFIFNEWDRIVESQNNIFNI